MKYKKLTGIILKKQNYREADQIITIWTREAGKVRLLARAIRSPKSKLAYSVQDLCLAEIDLAGRGSLMTLIGAKPLKQFKSIREDLDKAGAAFYAAELVLKMTADESPCEPVFDLLSEFLSGIDQTAAVRDYSGVDNFSLQLANHLGFGSPKKTDSHKDVSNFVQDLIERQLHSEKLLTELTFSA
jgi:DNA repair protein RecO